MKTVHWTVVLALLAVPGLLAFAEEGDRSGPATLVEMQRLIDTGDFAAAVAVGNELLANREREFGMDSPRVSVVLVDLAQCYGALKDYATAEKLARRGVKIAEKQSEPGVPSLLWSHLDNLARAIHFQGRYAEAETEYKRLLAVQSKELGPEHRRVIETLVLLARAQGSQGHDADSAPYLQRALDSLDKTAEPDSSILAEVVSTLTLAYMRADRPTRAEPLGRRGVAMYSRMYGSNAPPTARCMAMLGVTCTRVGKYAEGERLIRESISILERAYGPGHSDVVSGYEMLAGVLERTDREDQAAKIRERIKTAGAGER